MNGRMLAAYLGISEPVLPPIETDYGDRPVYRPEPSHKKQREKEISQGVS